MADKSYYATGRRKTSVAKVWVKPGTGNVLINRTPIAEFFPRDTLTLVVKQAIELIEGSDKYDIHAFVNGGGCTGQAGAVRLGISRCFAEMDEKNKKALRTAGFLTRDDREVERKKYGHKKARRSFQFSKR